MAQDFLLMLCSFMTPTVGLSSIIMILTVLPHVHFYFKTVGSHLGQEDDTVLGQYTLTSSPSHSFNRTITSALKFMAVW